MSDVVCLPEWVIQQELERLRCEQDQQRIQPFLEYPEHGFEYPPKEEDPAPPRVIIIPL